TRSSTTSGPGFWRPCSRRAPTWSSRSCHFTYTTEGANVATTAMDSPRPGRLRLRFAMHAAAASDVLLLDSGPVGRDDPDRGGVDRAHARRGRWRDRHRHRPG